MNPNIFATSFSLTSAIVPAVVVMLAIAFLLAIRYIASRYKKIPPGRVGIFYGRKYKWADEIVRGYLIVTGGGRILMPLVEDYLEVPTTAFQVEINEIGVPNKDTVKLKIHGVGTCKVSSEPSDLNKAIEALIDKLSMKGSKDDEGTDKSPLDAFVLNILQGHLRSIIGTLDINELLRDREAFNKRVMAESAEELKRFGIELQNLVIQDITDEEGYIDSLGKMAVAKAKAAADIETSNATRSSEVIKADNQAQISEAEKVGNVKQANYKKESEVAQAEADLAGPIARAAQEQKLKVAEADRDAAEKLAQIKVQESEAKRMTAQLEATTVATAAATKKKTIIDAEAAKEKLIIEADAEAEKLQRTAKAKRDANTLEGEGEANRKKSVLVAEAEGNAAAKREALNAEAEGTKNLAAALAQMTESARLIIILDKLPNLFDHGGDAGAKLLNAMFAPAAAAVGQIDKISIVEMGGNGQGISKVAGMVPDIVFQTIARLKAQGIDLTSLLSLLKIDTAGLEQLLGGVSPEASDSPTAPSTASE